ncbi:MAG: nicotinamide riboside transporter PnuC [Gemmatimonadaceae bacterium]|nr:nicotinamide riboside transporter PnuC [Gemmatimonadaceae bacterium]
MDPLEVVAVLFGVLSVWLSTREHIASWPTALVNTSLYCVILWREHLYANASLQLFYFTLSLYGWWAWKFGGREHTGVVVTRTSRRLAALLVAIGVAAAGLIAATLFRFTDSASPWLDSGTTATSLVAQWMMTRKLLENWLVWTVVNVVYIGMYLSQGLRLTAGLYVAFLVLAVLGYRSWRRSLASRLAVERGNADNVAPDRAATTPA